MPNLRRASKSLKSCSTQAMLSGSPVTWMASERRSMVTLKFVLEEAEIFVVGPVEGFYARSDFEGFFYQVVS